MVDYLGQSVWLLVARSSLVDALCVAVSGQEPHGGLPCAVCEAADVHEPHGGLPGAVGVAADG